MIVHTMYITCVKVKKKSLVKIPTTTSYGSKNDIYTYLLISHTTPF